MSLFGRKDAEHNTRIDSLEATVKALVTTASQHQKVLENMLEAHADLVVTVHNAIESQSSCSEEVVRALLATAKGMAGLHDDAMAALEAAIMAQDEVQLLRTQQLDIITVLHAREKSAEASMALPKTKTKAEGAN